MTTDKPDDWPCWEEGPLTGAKCTEQEGHNKIGTDHVADTVRKGNTIERWPNGKSN